MEGSGLPREIVDKLLAVDPKTEQVVESVASVAKTKPKRKQMCYRCRKRSLVSKWKVLWKDDGIHGIVECPHCGKTYPVTRNKEAADESSHN